MGDRSEELSQLGSANVSDALRKCGKAFCAMDGGIRPISNEMRVVGPAFTVRCYPGATYAMEKALELASPGDVLVIDAGGHSDVIVMGGLMSTRAQARLLAGAIVDGAVRDVDQITALGFGVFSRHICPRSGTFDEIGEWQTTICCGRIPVRPGDWIVADRSGVVVIPVEMLGEVVEKAQEIHRREDRMARHLGKGMSLSQSFEASSDGNGDV